MVLFNIIHPAHYLVTDSVQSEKNSIPINKIGVINKPVAVMEIAKRDDSIQHIELV